MPELRTVLVTCEHGGNRVPRPWQNLFAEQRILLQSHRGWDPGAERVARALARELRTEAVVSRTSRLLIDLNRSPGHPRQFSEFTRALGAKQKQLLIRRYYRPYRQKVERLVAHWAHAGTAVHHLSIHTFTPVWKGRVRPVDFGILFDPGRAAEKELAVDIREHLSAAFPSFTVRHNQPYRGVADGFTTWLRRAYGPDCYLGLELEINQKLMAVRRMWPRTVDLVVRALADALEG